MLTARRSAFLGKHGGSRSGYFALRGQWRTICRASRAAPAMPAHRDAAGNRMVGSYFQKRTSAARMINPDTINVIAYWICFANSAIFVSLADAQAVSLLRELCSVSVAPWKRR